MSTPTAPVLPDPYLPENGSDGYRVEHYDLDLECKLGGNHLAGTATITATAARALAKIEFDLAGLKVLKTSVNGKKAAFKMRGDRLVVSPATRVPAGELFTAAIRYAGSPGPRDGAWGEVGWEELDDGVLVAGQPNGAATWFPCNDHPSQKATYRIAVATDADYRAVCNGELVDHTRKASRERWVYEVREPMATYLATLQIGRYERWVIPADGAGIGGRHAAAVVLPAQILLAPAELKAKAEAAFADQPRMITTFSEAFGPYPFDAYAAVVTEDELEIPLEAHGLSIFGRNHLAPGWEQQRLIAHELSHQWFGNSLTAARLQDIWMHEGFACYAEWLWSEAAGQGTVNERARAAYAGLAKKPQDVRIGEPGPGNMFDDRVYKRGALTVHAVRLWLGDTAFFAMLRAWTQANRHGHVDYPRFIAHVDQAAGHADGAEELMRPWLFATALPPFPLSRA
ncbi:peptidase M1 [Kocuria polaris]|nr:peptidase M1 [Kocuria polaris]